VGAFVTVFLSRPVESVSVAGLRLSWLLAVINTYWTRLTYFTDLQTIDDDLVRAEADLVIRLADYHDRVDPTRGGPSEQAPGAPVNGASEQPSGAQPSGSGTGH
jgi:hypothetical protein